MNGVDGWDSAFGISEMTFFLIKLQKLPIFERL